MATVFILLTSYQKIVNPETGRKVSIHSNLGKKIINKYYSIIKKDR